MEIVMTERSVERRHMRRRHCVEEHGIVSSRVRAGHDALIVDISAGGILIETDRRLLPGSSVELQLETGKQRTAIRGRVLRSAVVRLRSNSVCYRAAVGFDRPLPWIWDDDLTGYPVPSPETRPGRSSRANATPHLW